MTKPDEVVERLKQVQRKLSVGIVDTPQDKLAVLNARAEQLARDDSRDDDEKVLEVITFTLGQERYAIDTTYVRKVLALDDLTLLPGVPAFVRGIINVRGQIIAVMDLGAILATESRATLDSAQLIVLSDGRREFGLSVSTIGGVLRLPVATIQPPISTLAAQAVPYIHGETAEHLVVLDAVRLLQDERLTVNEKITAQS